MKKNKKRFIKIAFAFSLLLIAIAIIKPQAKEITGEFIYIDEIELTALTDDNNYYDFTYNRQGLYNIGAFTENYETLRFDYIYENVKNSIRNTYDEYVEYITYYEISFSKAMQLDNDIYMELGLLESSLTTYTIFFNGGTEYNEIEYTTIEGGGDIQYIYAENIYQPQLNGAYFEYITNQDYISESAMIYKFSFRKISNDNLYDVISQLENQIQNLQREIISSDIQIESLQRELQALIDRYNSLVNDYNDLLDGSVSLPTLILTYIEIPYKVLYGFLDFELFGTQLFSALGGLITMLVILFVIKKFI